MVSQHDGPTSSRHSSTLVARLTRQGLLVETVDGGARWRVQCPQTQRRVTVGALDVGGGAAIFLWGGNWQVPSWEMDRVETSIVSFLRPPS